MLALRVIQEQGIEVEGINFYTGFCVIDGEIEPKDYKHAASIVARYGQGRNADNVKMTFTLPNANAQSIMVQPLTTEQVLKEWHV